MVFLSRQWRASHCYKCVVCRRSHSSCANYWARYKLEQRVKEDEIQRKLPHLPSPMKTPLSSLQGPVGGTLSHSTISVVLVHFEWKVWPLVNIYFKWVKESQVSNRWGGWHGKRKSNGKAKTAGDHNGETHASLLPVPFYCILKLMCRRYISRQNNSSDAFQAIKSMHV